MPDVPEGAADSGVHDVCFGFDVSKLDLVPAQKVVRVGEGEETHYKDYDEVLDLG